MDCIQIDCFDMVFYLPLTIFPPSTTNVVCSLKCTSDYRGRFYHVDFIMEVNIRILMRLLPESGSIEHKQMREQKTNGGGGGGGGAELIHLFFHIV